tara:strand:- start:2014 stop:2847 length:834 start_codon:yes stop_codon:yes gene_type:complete
MLNSTVIVKALKQHAWSGFHRFPKCKDTVIATYGRGGYDTGLTESEERDLEKVMNLEAGTLNRFSEYWQNYAVILTDKEKILKLDRPRDFLDYKILSRSEKVANSVNETDNWPKATYVLYDAEEDAKKDNLKVKEKRKAYKQFNSMTISEMKNVLKIMGKKADNASDELVENTLAEIVEQKASEFNETLALPDFKTRVLIEDLVNNNVLRIRGGHYMLGDSAVGHDLEATILYVKDPKNQDIVLSMKARLQGTTSSVKTVKEVETKMPKKAKKVDSE